MRIASGLSATLLCIASFAQPQALAADTTLSATASQDTSIYFGTAGSSGRSDGSGDYLWLAVTAEGLGRRALLKFDLSSIPPAAVIRQVTLTLYESRARDEHDVTVHRLLASWGEGASNAGGSGTGVQALAGDATWLHRFFPATFWANPGGDHDPLASAVQRVGLPNTTYSWAATRPAQGQPVPGLVRDVQAWVDTPSLNHGWMLIGNEAVEQNAKRFESRNNAVAVNRPRLTVVYGPPVVVVADDGDVPLPWWALGLLAALLARRAMSRPDHA